MKATVEKINTYIPLVIRADCFDWVQKNIKQNSIPLIITDPPYGNIVKQKWDLDWTYSHQIALTHLIDYCLIPGGTAYVWGGIGRPGDRLFFKWLGELEDDPCHMLQLYNYITWGKRRAYGTPYNYLYTREECAMLVKGERPSVFNIPLLDSKRGYKGFNPKYPAKSEFFRRSNVWSDINEIFNNKIHECEKPSRLAEIMIETSSNEGDLILDFFAGSGSTGIAAMKLNRKSILIEKSNCKMHRFE